MNDVKAKRVYGIENSIAELKSPGDFRWTALLAESETPQPGRMMFVCPCGCGDIAGISVKPVCETGWEWDGNLNEPTIKPSIAILDKMDLSAHPAHHWHGFLTAGVFQTC